MGKMTAVNARDAFGPGTTKKRRGTYVMTPARQAAFEKGRAMPKTLTTTPAILASYAARRTKAFIVVEGITSPQQLMLQPGEFSRLEIDPTYQRIRVTSMVNTLVHVLKAGGSIYDAVTLCRRKGSTTLYIVDGQQRFWAHYDCQLPMPVVIYDSTGPEAEALLYQVMNAKATQLADNIVKSHQGPSAELLRTVSGSPEHPLFNAIGFGDAVKRPFGAYRLISAMLEAACGLRHSGGAAPTCARLDHAMRYDAGATARAQALLYLLPAVFAAGRRPPVPMLAVGRAAYDHWRYVSADLTTQMGILPAIEALLPAKPVVDRIATINWDALCPHAALQFLPVLVTAINKRWPAFKLAVIKKKRGRA